MACHITSNLDFDKGGCVIQIEWTKALSIIMYTEVRKVYHKSMKQTLVFRI